MQGILALDLGSTAGWAVRTCTGTVNSGTWSHKASRFDGGGIRYVYFAKWLDEIEELLGPFQYIAYEEVRNHKGVDAAHVYGGLWAHLTAWAERKKIPYEGIPVGTIKKHITGKGNSGKELVIAGVRKLGFAPKDDNEADALALLDCVCVTLLTAAEGSGSIARSQQRRARVRVER